MTQTKNAKKNTLVNVLAILLVIAIIAAIIGFVGKNNALNDSAAFSEGNFCSTVFTVSGSFTETSLNCASQLFTCSRMVSSGRSGLKPYTLK